MSCRINCVCCRGLGETTRESEDGRLITEPCYSSRDYRWVGKLMPIDFDRAVKAAVDYANAMRERERANREKRLPNVQGDGD